MPALLSYTRSQKRAGEPTPEVTPGASSQGPDQFQPAASQITPAAGFPQKCPSPSHKPINNKILFGLADRTLTLAHAAGPNVAASGCARFLYSGKGGQRRAPARADTGTPLLPVRHTLTPERFWSAQGSQASLTNEFSLQRHTQPALWGRLPPTSPTAERFVPGSGSCSSNGKFAVQEFNSFTCKISQATALLK